MSFDFDEKMKKWKLNREKENNNAVADEKWSKLMDKLQPKPPEVLETAEYKRRTVANFVEDLGRGKKGEQSFYEKFSHLITPLNSKGADFEINKSAELIELKTDYYDNTLYPNFIIELESSNGTPGGVHKADKDECTYFIYYFITNDEIYCFNVKQLKRKIDKIRNTAKIHKRLNRGYETLYIKVPIKELLELALDLEDVGLFEKKGSKK